MTEVTVTIECDVPQRRELGFYAVNQDEFVGVQTISTLFAAAHAPTPVVIGSCRGVLIGMPTMPEKTAEHV